MVVSLESADGDGLELKNIKGLTLFGRRISCCAWFLNGPQVVSRDCWLVGLARFPRSSLDLTIEETGNQVCYP